MGTRSGEMRGEFGHILTHFNVYKVNYYNMLYYCPYASGAKGHKFESCTARHEFQALAVLP